MSFQAHIKSKWHWYVFSICLLISITPIFMMDYLITLDGPTHLHNANLFNHLLGGSEFTESYFEVNSKITPNYISLLLLSLLLTIFNSVVALKIFHLIFILLFAFSFLWWNRSIDKKGQSKLGFIVFPLIFSYLFHSGFYNFILAILLLFWTLSFYEKTKLKGLKKYFILSLLLLATYFAHSIAFAFTGLALGTFEMSQLLSNKNLRKEAFGNIAALVVAAIPSLLMTILFMGSRSSEVQYIAFPELIENLVTAKSISVRGMAGEWIKYCFILSITLSTIFILFRQKKELLKPSNYLFWTAILTLILYFILPDSVGYASVFSVRIEYFFWIFLFAFLARQQFKKEYLNYFLGLFTLIFSLIQLQGNLAFWKPLNVAAKQTMASSDFIENESIVYPIFTSNIWEHLHISNLLGAEKNLLILENNGAREDYFPVQYKQPFEKLLDSIPGLSVPMTNAINYVIKIGKNPAEAPRDITIYNEIKVKGTLVYENELVEVWKSN